MLIVKVSPLSRGVGGPKYLHGAASAGEFTKSGGRFPWRVEQARDECAHRWPSEFLWLVPFGDLKHLEGTVGAPVHRPRSCGVDAKAGMPLWGRQQVLVDVTCMGERGP